MELFAGCRSERHQRELGAFLKPFEKAGRLITPNHEHFREAGSVLARLAADGVGTMHRRLILNDVLIAVSAARTGVVVVTRNASDFERIGEFTPVRWILPA